jgi:OFA family oxalate/formate antiporter-like MFS transporter
MENNTGNRWLIAIAGMVIMLCSGAVYIWGVFQGPLAKMFGWSQATTALTFSITLGIFALGTIVGGRIQDKIGPREVASVGGLMIGLGVFLASFTTADKAWILYSTYGVIMGFGVGMIYTPVIACMSKWFPDKKGMITGLVVGSLGGGGLVFTPIAKSLVVSSGVLGTFAIFGISFGIIIIGAAQFLKNPPAGYTPVGWTPPAAGSAAAATAASNYTPGEMIKTPQFYLLSLILLIGCMSGLMVIPFGKILALQAGLSDAVATSAIMLISIGNAGGRFIWGATSDKIGRVRTLMILLLVSGVTMLFLNAAVGVMSLIGIGIVAFCYGGFLGTMPATIAEFFGAKNLGVNYGLVLLFFSASAVGAPLVSAMAKDATGNFKSAFLIGGVASLIGLGLALITKPPAVKGA